MAKRKKEEEKVDSYRHEADSRKNVVPVGLAFYDILTSKPKKYEYDPHLDNIKQQFPTANNQGMNLHITLPVPARWLGTTKGG